MKNLQFIQTSPEELNELIQEGVKNQIEFLTKSLGSKNSNDDLMTRKETCDYLKINLSTLWAWTKKGKIQSYSIGNRVYYKRNEVQESLIPLK